jgi:hypothetical protein
MTFTLEIIKSYGMNKFNQNENHSTKNIRYIASFDMIVLFFHVMKLK